MKLFQNAIQIYSLHCISQITMQVLHIYIALDEYTIDTLSYSETNVCIYHKVFTNRMTTGKLEAILQMASDR